MKIKYYIYDTLQEVNVQSDFVPRVGDSVSLVGCDNIPNHLQIESMKVVGRTYIVWSDSIIVELKKKNDI
jgi:hypothetical protein